MKDKVKSRGSSLDNASLSTFHVTVFHSDLTYQAHKMKQYFAIYLIFILLFFFCNSVIAGNFYFLTKNNIQCEDVCTHTLIFLAS